MALANYSDLVASVANWMARSDLTSVIPDFVTIFEARNNEMLRHRRMETRATLTTVGGEIDLPTDYLARRKLRFDGNPGGRLAYLTPDAFDERYPILQTGVPTEYTIEGTTLRVGDYDDTQSLVLLYYARIPNLVTTATNWVMDTRPDLYLAGCLVEAYAYVKEYDDAAAWRSREDDIRGQMMASDQKSHGSSEIQAVGAYTP